MVLIILSILIAGVRCSSGARILYYNGTFQQFLGLSTFPRVSCITRFLAHLPERSVRGILKIHDKLRMRAFSFHRTRTSIVLDMDSTVLPVFGFQEGAAIGFNPRRRGYPSYHPLLCFEGHTRDYWHGAFRPGNTVSSSGARQFLEECFAKIPQNIYRVRVRADSGFFAKEIIVYIDDNKAHYVIASRVYPNIKERLESFTYTRFKAGYEVAEYWYRPLRWKKPHRFVVIRRPVPTKKPSMQLRLFTFKGYAYQILITNLSVSCARVWHFYNNRWNAELDIKELKESFMLSHVQSGTWQANVTSFHLLLFAYNIVNWFKRLCLPDCCDHWSMKTLRTELLVLPAHVVNRSNRKYLKLPRDYVNKKLFLKVAENIESLHF